MTIRKRNDARGYEHGAMGIDDDLGSDFTKKYNVPNRRGDSYPGGTKGGSEGNGHEPSDERSYAGAYTENESGLTQGTDFQFSAESRQIWEDVEANQRPGGDDNTDFDTTGPIRSGVSKKQGK